jgi:GH35 family endo-1,4-beta-xylanase
MLMMNLHLDSSGSKVDATIALVERLKRRGVPIHGVGIQAHLILGMIGDDVEEQLQRMGILGLDVAITELDIRILKDVTDEKLLQQQDVRQHFRTIQEYSGLMQKEETNDEYRITKQSLPRA